MIFQEKKKSYGNYSKTCRTNKNHFFIYFSLPRILYERFNSAFISELFLRVIRKVVLLFFNFAV